MKKFLAAVLTAMLALSMTACGSEEEETSSDYTPPSNITIYVESGDTAVPVDVDVSNMTNPFAYITMIIDLPKGFVADQQTAMDAGAVIAYKGSAKTSSECYTFANTGSIGDINEITEEEMTANYLSQFEGFTEFSNFSKTKCDGFDALDIGFERKIQKATVYQRQYFIFTDSDTYVISYTTEEKKTIADYEKSLTTIIVK